MVTEDAARPVHVRVWCDTAHHRRGRGPGHCWRVPAGRQLRHGAPESRTRLPQHSTPSLATCYRTHTSRHSCSHVCGYRGVLFAPVRCWRQKALRSACPAPRVAASATPRRCAALAPGPHTPARHDAPDRRLRLRAPWQVAVAERVGQRAAFEMALLSENVSAADAKVRAPPRPAETPRPSRSRASRRASALTPLPLPPAPLVWFA